MRTVDAASGKWKQILPMLGIDARYLDGQHHECPSTGQGEDRFRFANRNGSGNYFCACSNGKSGGIGLLCCAHGWDFARAAKEVDGMIGNADDDKIEKPKSDPAIRLRRIWDESIPAADDVIGYLNARAIKRVSKRLRQASVMYYEAGVPQREYSAMVAQVSDANGQPASIHVTYLEGAAKASVTTPRKLLPPMRDWDGGAVRLFPATDMLGVAEGIETALTAAEMDDVPVWAAVSAGNMEKFIWPSTVTHLRIYGDNDRSFTGQKAAYTLAFRAQRAGLHVSVIIPEKGGADWNDVAMYSR